MAEPSDRYYLAAVVAALGRTQALRAVGRAGDPRRAFLHLHEPAAEPEQIEADCTRHGIALLLAGDPAYPALLGQIADPPPLLYARGDLDVLLRPGAAVVGARRCSRTGAEVAAALGAGLAGCGVAVISGLALGIDAAAHRAALGQGVTVAVLGSGLLQPSPARHAGLLERILDGGGLALSEYPPRLGARPYHFPERNRLISGIALGVVVVEASERSGSLITARLALEQGREVCAVPGAVTNPLSRGCHRLLREGAALIEGAGDVVDALGLADYATARQRAPAQAPELDAPTLAPILAAVESRLTTLDEVVAVTGCSGAEASAALVELELAGFVRQVPGGYIRRPSA